MQRGKRAQISLEALLLFAVFLSVLAIALAASSNIGRMAQDRTDQSIAQQEFNEFSSKMRSACTLGEGNVRRFSSSGEAQLSKNGREFSFTLKGHSFSSEIPCEIGALPSGGSAFTIENVQGEIQVSLT